MLLVRRYLQVLPIKLQSVRENPRKVGRQSLLMQNLLNEEAIGVAGDDAGNSLCFEIVQQFAHARSQLGTPEDFPDLVDSHTQLVEFVVDLSGSEERYKLHKLSPLCCLCEFLQVLRQVPSLEQLIDYGVRILVDKGVVEVEHEQLL